MDRRAADIDSPSAGSISIPGQVRVAVATDRPLQRWQADCIRAIAAVDGVTIEAWIESAFEVPADARPRDAGARDTVEAPASLRRLRPEDAATLDASRGDRQVDVLLDLTHDGLALPVTWAIEVWHYAYGRDLTRDPDRAALVDYVRGPGVARVTLVSEPSGAIVREGWLERASWWSGRPVERLLVDAADWPAIALRTMVELGTARSNPAGAEPSRGASTASVPLPLLRAAAVGRRMRGWFDVLARHPDWNIGLIDEPIDRMLLDDPGRTVTWLPLRDGHYSADPFGIERDGVLHVLFEDFDQASSRGSISALSIDRDGRVSEPEPVLDPGVHASYPYLIEDAGTVYMLPETSAAGELVLYEASDFPRDWRPVATILPGIPAVDPTMVEHDGRWWLFASRADRGANQNLFIWHAPRITGPWEAHRTNPVKTDARSARPAGTPFHAAGRLYRPSQDNARVYGGRLVINEIDVLTPSEYSEHPVRIIGPWPGSPYRDGLHTLSAVGGRTLIDGNRKHLVQGALRFHVQGKLPRRGP